LHKHQQLHLQTQPGCYAAVDLDLMNDLIENLISNAIKFTPHHKNIWINVDSSEEMIRLMIRDEGQGFRPQELPALFRPFQRLSARPTGGESSTGLGLSIVHQIIQLHNGHIHVESEGEGKGSRFTVCIPGIKLTNHNPVEADPVWRGSIN
jgi:signal transduction histidine kinase